MGQHRLGHGGQIGGVAHQHPIGDDLLLKAARPFEDRQRYRAGAMKEPRDNLGREKGRGDACALQLVFGRIDRGRDVEA